MDEIDAIGGKRFSEGTSADREARGWTRLGSLPCWGLWAACAAAMCRLACLSQPLTYAPWRPGAALVQVQRTLMELLSQLDGFEKLGKVGNESGLLVERPTCELPSCTRDYSGRMCASALRYKQGHAPS